MRQLNTLKVSTLLTTCQYADVFASTSRSLVELNLIILASESNPITLPQKDREPRMHLAFVVFFSNRYCRLSRFFNCCPPSDVQLVQSSSNSSFFRQCPNSVVFECLTVALVLAPNQMIAQSEFSRLPIANPV